MRDGNYKWSNTLIEKAKGAVIFRDELKKIQDKWEDGKIQEQNKPKKKTRRSYKSRKKGLRTTEDEFKGPILEAIMKSWGYCQSVDILEIIFEKIRNRLKEYDLESLPAIFQ